LVAVAEVGLLESKAAVQRRVALAEVVAVDSLFCVI
jgi:hypothetical protein